MKLFKTMLLGRALSVG